MKNDILKKLESNIISWYDFKKDSRILYYGDDDSNAYKYLKARNFTIKKVKDIIEEKSYYDYLVILKDDAEIENIIKMTKYLKEDGIILYAFNNSYGISKFVSYDHIKRISPLEKIEEDKISRKDIIKIFQENGYKNIKTFMPFPNWKNADIILTDEIENLSDKIDKYFVSYDENSAILVDEINLLRKISKYDKELFVDLSNSYLLEISKSSTNTYTKYISFNNYRKREYQLITLINDEIVEKKAATRGAEKNLTRIANDIKFFNYENVILLDKYENNKLFSNYIKNKNTLDIELGLRANDEEFLTETLNNLKKILLKNSIPYNKKDKKSYINSLKQQNDEMLSKFNYIEYAFYDMVPKNCFLIDNKYYFFDQEWMEKYLPVEFIIYRSIINSYDLVRKIDINNILEKLDIKQYRELFDEIDKELRTKILDENAFMELNKNNTKMYEIVYEKEVLSKQVEDYKENDKKQNDYIKHLEQQLTIERGK